MYQHLLAPIQQFLQCETPDAWIEEAKKPKNLSIILQDHMLCELKAAQSAMFLLRKYAADSESNQNLLLWMKPYEDFAYRKIGDLNSLKGKSQITKKIEPRSDQPYAAEIIDKMVLLIKEELHHFYQVLEIIEQRGIELENISAGRYAKGLMREVINHEPHTLVDKLIIGAFIEARSCERFAKLAPYLDAQLEKFYVSLLRSEARHYEDYLTLAQQIAAQDISARVAHFARVEAELISTPDDEFKFHSGVPSA
ncbi:tRNA isopentenyl-2-thiomethyl-A-37 hydroxylase MiaE [Testudinibacter aquarius]|uniref:tRNA-(Ms[2]io[6]A)-hydroxylase n=1 Tax=Testudinibacter aquarius TaxID=1524974 RepID=A0A4R3YBM1_9PAST|nr:tRNA isopentenyl-2-thiomethyl-A-37 hydroxylase MiaE [Testudinibacter aquarius]KAE9529871.1 tRNA hydroxylase [Testudinibacter aquarius]TCV89360.1 tRNA-(ms[2]io[6]A)-hydroxylase [Testudinibacter aquarius]TNG93142.1 tRNA-(ms[2]io[6]A)-hydroxylase [Testudinibacter aquarius]